ncbi:hypothetical protein BN1356_01195 [Streptococcus varani]|uniref:Uncharacterized protein n=1 Tax=Streptococcus varani TaxID=1608583 RepID=A0A0E4H4T9_9STRE|nr:hypothetical protein [Streptococcus varani]CQR24840.1 hypothetical protein BN1356_01195 [Streptococcus varani]
MKTSRHWKLETFIVAVSFLVIPLIYLLFSPFFGQILFVPLVYTILPILVIKRYGYLFYYPLGVSLVYSLFLLILSWTWPLDFSLIPLAFGTILIPTVIGYLIGFFHLKFADPKQRWLLPIHCISSTVLVYVVTIQYMSQNANSLLAHLCTYIFLPFIFIGCQGLITYLYPSNRYSPLVTALVFQLIYAFTGHGYLSWLTFLYIGLAYGIMYLVIVYIKKEKFVW